MDELSWQHWQSHLGITRRTSEGPTGEPIDEARGSTKRPPKVGPSGLSRGPFFVALDSNWDWIWQGSETKIEKSLL